MSGTSVPTLPKASSWSLTDLPFLMFVLGHYHDTTYWTDFFKTLVGPPRKPGLYLTAVSALQLFLNRLQAYPFMSFT